MSVRQILKQIVVEPVLFLYMFATFMQYTVLQELLYRKVCESHYNETICDDLFDERNDVALELVQRETSFWILVSTVSLALPSIVTSNLLGSWGDTFGRKYPLAIPSIGSVLSCIVYIWMSLMSVGVWPVVIASALSGIFGGVVSCIMAVMSYVSSISSAPKRTARVSLLEAMTFVGGTVGPFAGGALLFYTNHAIVFLVIALCHLLIIVYVIIRVPDIKSSEISTNQEKSSYCNMAHHFKSSAEACFKKRPHNARAAIMCYLICCLVIMTTTTGEIDVSYLFVKDQPLMWGYNKYSYYFGIKYALGSLALLLGTPILTHYQVSDHVICGMGIISKIAGFVILGFAGTSTLMYLVPFASMLSFFCIPALRSLISKQVETEELGKMFAFMATIENLSLLLAAVVFNSIYPYTKKIYQGFIFHIEAALQIIPITVLIWSLLRYRRTTPANSYSSLPPDSKAIR